MAQRDGLASPKQHGHVGPASRTPPLHSFSHWLNDKFSHRIIFGNDVGPATGLGAFYATPQTFWAFIIGHNKTI